MSTQIYTIDNCTIRYLREYMPAVSPTPWPMKHYRLPQQTSITTIATTDDKPKPSDPATNLPAFLDEKLPTLPYPLDHYDRAQIETLLRRIFRRDVDAIDFLCEHNHALRAKPLELLTRDQQGCERVLAYLRQAADNAPPSDPVERALFD